MAFLRSLRRTATATLFVGVAVILSLVYLVPRLPPQNLP